MKKKYIYKFTEHILNTPWYFKMWSSLALFILIISLIYGDNPLKTILGIIALICIYGAIWFGKNHNFAIKSTVRFNYLFIGWTLILFFIVFNNNWWFYDHIKRVSHRFTQNYSTFVISDFKNYMKQNEVYGDPHNPFEYSKLIDNLNARNDTTRIPYYISKINILFPEVYVAGDIGWGVLGPSTTKKYREVIHLGPEYFSASKTEPSIYDLAIAINPENADRKSIEAFQTAYMDMKGDYTINDTTLNFPNPNLGKDDTYQRSLEITLKTGKYTTEPTSGFFPLKILEKTIRNLFFSVDIIVVKVLKKGVSWDSLTEYIATYVLPSSIPILWYGCICLVIPFIIILIDNKHKENVADIEQLLQRKIDALKKEDLPDELCDDLEYIQEQLPLLLSELKDEKFKNNNIQKKYDDLKSNYMVLQEKYNQLNDKYRKDIDDFQVQLNSLKIELEECQKLNKKPNQEIEDKDIKTIDNKSYYAKLKEDLLYDIKIDPSNIISAIDAHGSQKFVKKVFNKLNKNEVVKNYITKIKTDKYTPSKKEFKINRKRRVINKTFTFTVSDLTSDKGYSAKATLTTKNLEETVRLLLFIRNTIKDYKDYKIIDKT